MISNPFKAATCGVCRRDFEKNDQIDRTDEVLTTRAVMEGRFECENCRCVFHGKCGRIGQVSSTKASVTCPSCKLKQKLPLPFSFAQDGKKKPGSGDAFIDQLQEMDQTRNQKSNKGGSPKGSGRGSYSTPSFSGASKLLENGVTIFQGGAGTGLLATVCAAVPALIIDALFVSDAWRIYNKSWPLLTWGGTMQVLVGIVFIICILVTVFGLATCFLNLPSRSGFFGMLLAAVSLVIHVGSVYYARGLLFD